MSDDGPAAGATRDDGGAAGTAARSRPGSEPERGTESGAGTGGGAEGGDRDGEGPGAPSASAGVGGRRFVAVLYVLLVAFTAVAGALFARVVEDPEPPRLLFLVPLPPTSLGFAVYGAVTVGLLLGVPLALVAYVSRREDLAGAGGG